MCVEVVWRRVPICLSVCLSGSRAALMCAGFHRVVCTTRPPTVLISRTSTTFARCRSIPTRKCLDFTRTPTLPRTTRKLTRLSHGTHTYTQLLNRMRFPRLFWTRHKSQYNPGLWTWSLVVHCYEEWYENSWHYNILIKYADDVDLLVPETSVTEFNSVKVWETQNKMVINCLITKEMVSSKSA